METIDIIRFDNAEIWYYDHKDHVDELYESAVRSTRPTDNLTLRNPDLWRPAHWKWFIDNHLKL